MFVYAFVQYLYFLPPASLVYYLGILPSEIGWLALAGVLSAINFWTLTSPYYILKKLLFNFEKWYISIQATLALVGVEVWGGSVLPRLLWILAMS